MRTSLLLGSLAAVLWTSNAEAVDLYVAAGTGGIKTRWEGDFGGYGSLKFGIGPTDWLSFYFLGRLGYAAVDQRILTLVTAGAQVSPWTFGPMKPYVRLSFAHQHEEPVIVFQEEPVGAIFGIGDGIRHRGGLEMAAGLDVTLDEPSEAVSIYGTAEAATLWFYDDRGPAFYPGVHFALGLNYAL